MGYTNETTHYGIPLPLGSDKTTPMDYNQSAQEVDTVLFEAKSDSASALQKANQLQQDLSTTNDNVTGVTGRVTTLEGTVATQGEAITRHEIAISDVRQDAEDMIVAKELTQAQMSSSTEALAVGTYFRYNDVLYRVTQAISIGDTIVPNTNCVATNVTTEIKALKDDLETKVSYVSVSGDTYSSVMTKLNNLIDRSKLTEKSCMRTGNNVAQCAEVSVGQFVNTQVAGSSYNVIRYDLTNNNVLVWTTNTTGSSMTDASSDTVNAGTIFEIWY